MPCVMILVLIHAEFSLICSTVSYEPIRSARGVQEKQDHKI